jgi:magnesium-transporting ATPase (P-type)
VNIFSTGLHLFLIVVALIFWKLRFFPSNSLVANHKTTLVWLAFMSACAISLYFALEKWSSPSVRDDAGEVSFYLIFSLVWIALTQSAFVFLGISIRDDVAERRSRSAGLAAAGLTIAAAC